MCVMFAASSGVVGATETVVGLLAIPTMLKYAYSKRLISGTIAKLTRTTAMPATIATVPPLMAARTFWLAAMATTIQVPTLRERGEDILLLAEHFLAECNAQSGMEKQFDENVKEALRLHDWPGNVRELRNALERAILLGDGRIGADDLFAAPLHAARPGNGLPFPAPLAEIERDTIVTADTAVGPPMLCANATRAPST